MLHEANTFVPIVFMISFFVARTLFTIDDKKTAADSQKATDITEKTTEDTNTDDKVIIAQQSDLGEDDADQATAITGNDDVDEPATSNNNSTNNNVGC